MEVCGVYAIVEAGGKQYRVRPGDVVNVERLDAEPEATVEFSRVLAVKNGDSLVVGKPLVEGALVKGRVLSHQRGDKILVFKYKPKKGYRRKRGHRQWYTRVRVEEILTADD